MIDRVTIFYNYACQTAASVESPIADACHAVGDCNACQTAASGESILADACHAVRDSDACQTTAIAECTISYLSRSSRDNYISLQQLPIDIDVFSFIHRIGRGIGKLYLQPS